MKSYLSGKSSRSAIARLVTIAFFVFGISNLAQAKDPTTPSKAIIEYSRSPDSLIISYTLILGEIAGTDRGPSLRVYGDGLAYVHYPVYMTRAGDYGFQLSKDEMVKLIDSLAADGVVDFDTTGVKETVRETDTLRRENDGVMHYVSDPSTSVIELNLLSYTPPGVTGLQQIKLNKTVRWSGLQSDARTYPGHVAIQKLASAEQNLRAFMERPDLVKLEPQADSASTVPGRD